VFSPVSLEPAELAEKDKIGLNAIPKKDSAIYYSFFPLCELCGLCERILSSFLFLLRKL
jgi:hypothetical protein